MSACPASRIAAPWVIGILLLAGCTAMVQEPPNLSPLKKRIRAYVESGQYQQEIARVAAQAKSWVEERSRRGGARLTVVFDLDETLLLNWPHISAMDFGYITKEWDKWVDAAEATAIEPVRDVYRAARARNVDVVFITSRTERDRAGTERNLRAIECADYVALVCKPVDFQGTSATFKTATRKKLTEQGRTIIANVGDQESDLVGGYAERTFKLPNAFYLAE